MVNNPRKVLWTPPPVPLPDEGPERSKPGPIYDLAIVQNLVKSGGNQIFPITERCEADLEKLEWDVDDVAKVIAVLAAEDYHASEWCKGRSSIVIDADAYAIRYNHLEECRGDHRHAQYYIKFGFRNNDTTLIVLLFSCHLSS